MPPFFRVLPLASPWCLPSQGGPALTPPPRSQPGSRARVCAASARGGACHSVSGGFPGESAGIGYPFRSGSQSERFQRVRGTTRAPTGSSWHGTGARMTASTTWLGCGGERAWELRVGRRRCVVCGRQSSVTAGTIFHKSRTPLTVLFAAAWLLTSQKNRVSARVFRRVFGIGSYQTAWAMLHHYRTAMVRPGAKPRSAISGRPGTERAKRHDRKPSDPAAVPRNTGPQPSGPTLVIGSQGRGALSSPVPHPPFNPYVPFSRIRLTGGLLDMVTLPLGIGWFRASGTGPGRGTRLTSTGLLDRHAGCDPASSRASGRAATTRTCRSRRT